MKIEQTLEKLMHYYATTRGIGHTHAMIKGIESNIKARVLVVSHQHAKSINQNFHTKASFISLQSIENGSLLGLKSPLVIDNFTLESICSRSCVRITELKTKLKKIQELANE